jgi:hypothetical protein
MKKLIKKLLRESLSSETWYHGTPDARGVEKSGGFDSNKISVDYVNDPEGFIAHQEKLKTARESGDKNEYFKLLNDTDKYKKKFTYNKPVFLTDKYSVAKTYANPKRSLDYQNAIEKVIKVNVTCNKVAKIIATGDRFRFMSVNKVKNGFMNSGVSEEEITKLIKMFNYYVSDNKGIKTDVVGAIGDYLEFDCIDVVGVLDSYSGGSTKSTVRMVLDPSNIKLDKT